MYKNFFKLQSNPFTTSPDPRFLYMLPHTREALAKVQYGISYRVGFMVLSGEVGTGKTTILRRALMSLDQRTVHSAFIFNPRLEVLELLEFILADFGITPESRTKSTMLIQLNRWLIDKFRRNETCVIIIDEAQNLTAELLEEIRLLTNLETSSEKLVQIILSGQPELEEMLRQPNLRQLRQRVAVWARTEALTEPQTGEYIAERLRVAGTSEPIFLPEAVTEIYRASRGIPRVINVICEHALISAYVADSRQIPAAMLGDVIQDLDLGTPSVLFSSAPTAYSHSDKEP